MWSVGSQKLFLSLFSQEIFESMLFCCVFKVMLLVPYSRVLLLSEQFIHRKEPEYLVTAIPSSFIIRCVCLEMSLEYSSFPLIFFLYVYVELLSSFYLLILLPVFWKLYENVFFPVFSFFKRSLLSNIWFLFLS